MRIFGRLPLVLVSCAVLACDAKGDATSGRECRSDDECSAEQACTVVAFGAGDLELANICPNPAPVQPCTPDTCGPGQTCMPGIFCANPFPTCYFGCSVPGANPCAPGTYCGPSGACEPVRCEDPLSVGCPPGMACDPQYVPNPAAPTDRYFPSATDHPGAVSGFRTEAEHTAALTGCVFLRCDQSGAFQCIDTYECAPEEADPWTTGCVPRPCEENGACSSDSFICEPTSSMGRPPAVDPHGCVRKNCEEGFDCGPFSVCDFTRSGEQTGCFRLPCDEPGGGCEETDGEKCDPEPKLLPSGRTTDPDEAGCVGRHCSIDGHPCPGGYTCEPEDADSSLTGCLPIPPAATGGVSGTGGAPATGGAATGGVATGGTAAATGGTTSSSVATCTSDSECDSGYCVNERCASLPGLCR